MLVVVLLTVDCSRFGGALLPTSFEQIIKHRQEGGGEEVAVAHTPPKELPVPGPLFLVHNPLVTVDG